MQDVTVVFDLDGTLVDTAPDLVNATNHVLTRQGLDPVAACELRPWVSFGARRMIEEALAAHGIAQGQAEVDEMLAAFIVHYAANIAVDSRPFPGMIAALDRLKAAGARLSVCTNKRESLSRQLLAALGVMDRFAGLAGRDTFPVCKPDPAHVTGAIALAGGARDRAVMVGDSLNDVLAAKAAGVPVVAVSFGYTDIPAQDLGADIVIDHFSQLEAAIRRLV
ncbi:MAG: HAD family hydrolase [Hyphomicrobiaceae bacterium]|nr:HAD family hydrolase [Hyphomicrobiaceae bacterium]